MLWQLRQLTFINIIAVLVAASWFVMHREPMRIPGPAVLLLSIAFHCAVMVWKLGRMSSRYTGFLHAQGLTRDQIWRHTFLATLTSGAIVSLMSAFVIHSGLRSWVQDNVYESPYFLVPVASEKWIPLLVMFHYSVMLPLMHYTWVRANQPFRGTTGGWMMMSLGLCFYLWSFGMAYGHRSSPGFLTIVALAHLPAIVLLLITCRRVHRTLEVRS